MRLKCHKCESNGKTSSKFHRTGVYYRTSDKKYVQRFRCVDCRTNFSYATFDPCYRQKKRHKNALLRELLCSGVSLRRSAKILNINRITVVRKFLFLSLYAEFELMKENSLKPQARTMEFDDLETFEHTKCKPISITLAVESKSRRILGIEISQMPAKGMLVAKAKKYGLRVDERRSGRRRLFRRMRHTLTEDAYIKSDSNPHYEGDVKDFFPLSVHKRYLGKRGAITAQGELKKLRFDPLFSLNHTCAMFRANVNRLFRKTWCTTKDRNRLYAHLVLYAQYHNQYLI